MINICDEALGTKISADKISSDGYEVDNLLKIQSSIFNRRGFMTERFVKPPVILCAKFPISFEISHIIIQTNVGAQKSDGINVFSLLETDDVLIAKIFNESTNFVCLFNQNFSQDRCSNLENELKIKYQLIYARKICLLRSSGIKIQIIRTVNGSVPCINYIKVFGIPSKANLKDNVDNFINLYQSIIKSRQSAPGTSHKSIIKLEKCLPVLDKVPDEFIDQITCEFMTLPMLLPSGHTIDRATLDRHVEAEEIWGRKANDPYTGISFTENSQPIQNVSLKARIDTYLIKNEVTFMNVPRTLGRDPSKRKYENCELIESQTAKISKLEKDSADLIHENPGASHEDRLSSSLTSALNKVMKSSSLRNKEKLTVPKCYICDVNHGNSYYKLGCSHLICIKCMKMNPKNCKCGVIISRKEVQKTYT